VVGSVRITTFDFANHSFDFDNSKLFIMTEIVFPLEACSINQLCGADPVAQQCFRDAHPGIGGGHLLLAPYQPYLLSPLNKESSHIYSQVRAMPPRQREVIAHTVDQHGEDTWAIVQFYNERIRPLQHRAIPT
jgi:hypothetical protein